MISAGARLLRDVLPAAAAALVVTPELAGLGEHRYGPSLVAFRPVAATALLTLAGTVARRRTGARAPALGVVAVAAGALAGVAHRARPAVLAAPSRGATLRVFAFNVWLGRADVAALARAVGEHAPDVVVLPEAGDEYRTALVGALDGLGYRSWSALRRPDDEASGMTVLVAPALGDVTVRAVDLPTDLAWLELCGGGLGTVRLAAVHTVAPLPHRVPEWARELRMLRRWLGDPGRPAVVVGDLNATLDHAVLREVLGDGVSVAAARGRGLVGTWPLRWPRALGVAIDHVLTSGPVTSEGLRVLDLPGSDHRALLADLRLPT